MGAERVPFLGRLKRGRLLFDGAMGSMLIDAGLEAGACPESWNRDRPEAVRHVHAAYVAAGADVVTTNTFGATPSRLRGYGLAVDAGDGGDVINAGVALAREAAAGRGRYVALSVGPTGKMLPPVGTATEPEIEEEFAGQLRCLRQPIDLVLGETFFDIREALAALAAARRLVDVPVGVGLTFNRTPRGFFTVMGDTPAGAVASLEAAGADFVAVNCSLASADMVDLAATIREVTALPLLCQPNAGEPGVVDGKPAYAQHPESFARDAQRMLEAGVEAVGGCCGTTPEFIRRARELVDELD